MTTPTAPRAHAARALIAGQHGLFVLLLAVATVRAWQLGDRDVVVTVGVLATSAWYAGGALVARRAQRSTSTVAVAWFAGLVACWVALLCVSPEFSWVAFALFLLAVHVLPFALALPVVAGLTCTVIGVQVHAVPGNVAGQVLGPLMGALVAVGIGRGVQRLARESEERRQLVADLIAAQDDLVLLHDELARAGREAGVLAERARLARDIHDTLAQGFSSIVLLARAGLADAGEPGTRRILGQIETTAGENLEEARRVVHALTPAGLDDAPLPGALERLLTRLNEQTGIEVGLTVDGQARTVGASSEVALLRLAQGALANVRLHSGAHRVALTLTYGEREVTLDVVDDGTGFDPERLEAAPLGGTGFGLRAMRDRLAEIGGHLAIETAPGEGTAIAATVPAVAPVGTDTQEVLA